MESVIAETTNEQATNCDAQNDQATKAASTSQTKTNVAMQQAELTAASATEHETETSTSSSATAAANVTVEPTLASKQMAAGLLQMFEPPVDRVRAQLKELINKQNQIYVQLSAEKFKLDSAEMAQMQEMMDDVKVYKEKLLKIKKDMHQIHQKTQSLKKRAFYIEECKQKELQRKLQKQQQEESLIPKKEPNSRVEQQN